MATRAIPLRELADLCGAVSIADLERIGRFAGLTIFCAKGFGYGVPLADLEKWRDAYARVGALMR
jgi:hypothetical protein